MGVIFLALLITPVVELWFLIQIGTWLGALSTILLVVLTAAWGAFLTRREGLRVLSSYQQSIMRGEMPTSALLDGLSVFVGGALLLTPGFFTDALGFALLLEPSRALFKDFLVRWAQEKIKSGQIVVNGGGGFGPSSHFYRSGEVIDQQFDEDK